jgi:hypothetical protein
VRGDGLALCQYVASAFEVRVFGECEVSPDLGDLGDENLDPWDPGYSINTLYLLQVVTNQESKPDPVVPSRGPGAL